MSDETETTGEVARVLGEHYPEQTSYDAGDLQGCMCGWQVPAPRTYGESDWAAYYAHQAAILAEAGLLATGEHLAWERGYTWGINDEQNGTTTPNPYPAQIAASVPAGRPSAGSAGRGGSGGVGGASGSAYALEQAKRVRRAMTELAWIFQTLTASERQMFDAFEVMIEQALEAPKTETNENEGA